MNVAIAGGTPAIGIGETGEGVVERLRNGASIPAMMDTARSIRLAPNIAIDTIAPWAIVEPMTDDADIEALLPLPEATFHILLALADADRHGYAILLDVAERTKGEVKLGAGTLYRSIQRMQEQGLIVETRDRPAPELDDERRRYYRITPFGTAVARAESRRFARLVQLARARGLAPKTA